MPPPRQDGALVPAGGAAVAAGEAEQLADACVRFVLGLELPARRAVLSVPVQQVR